MKHWAVDVRVDGNRVLTIESNSLGGAENIDEYADEVRACAESLLSFIGSPVPSPNTSEPGGTTPPQITRFFCENCALYFDKYRTHCPKCGRKLTDKNG